MVIFHSYVKLPEGTEKEVSRLAIKIGTPHFDWDDEIFSAEWNQHL